MRKLNEIKSEIESQVDYYENNRDYSDMYMDMLGDNLQYNNVPEDEIYRLLDADLYTDTDYSYLNDDAIAVFPMGEIEICIDTNLTEKEYNAIESQLDQVSEYKYNDGESYLRVFICTGMNIRVYENKVEVA